MSTLKRISAKGFKSFANKTELVFQNGFNCVLGPNGSGKSNIVDSICFVLGKSSAKDMRAERSAHLIYNGGKKKNPAKEAEVTIVFDNNEGKFPIKGKEIAVTRTVKQNGTSAYKINDRTVTRQQILDVLRADRIDPDGHNIVLQGDIIHFMEMKPQERRMIIEEIAGISGFEEKKQKCLNELTKVDSQLNEAEIILKERETNLRELKKERDQASRYKELQETIKDEKATYLHLHIKTKESNISEIETRKKELEDKIQKTTLEIEEHKKAIHTLQEEIKKINIDIEQKGEKEQLLLRKEIDSLKEEHIKARTRTESCTTELSKIKTRKQQLQENITELEDKIKTLTEQKKELENKTTTLLAEETTLLNKIKQFKEKHGIETNLSLALEALEKEADNNIHIYQEIQLKKQELIKTKTKLEFQLNNNEEKTNIFKGTTKTKELETLKENKNKLKETTTTLTRALNEDSSHSIILTTTRQKLNELGQELAKLQARNISFLERSHADLAVKKILDSGIKGIHGTVSHLGRADAKYSLALDVAAGARSQNIVVDTDATAQRCINHLKENKYGIATFLPLNKIKTRIIEDQVKGLLNDKAVHGLAVNLIKHKPEYKNVFSYIFGSSVIVDNLEAARRIGIGRARMITLEGDLLEPSGAMIGGYRAARPTFSFKETNLEEDIQKAETEIIKLQKLIDHTEQKRTENDVLITTLREQRANLEGSVITLEKSLNLEGLDMANLLEEKKSLIQELKTKEQELNNLENKEKGLAKEAEALKAKKTMLKEKLSSPELAKTLEDLEGQRLPLKEQLVELQAAIKNIDMHVQNILLPESEKTRKIIKQHDAEHEKFNQELESLQEIIKKRAQELKTKEQEESKFHTNLKDLILTRKKIEDKIQTKQATIYREEEKTSSVQQRLNIISIERAKAIAELEGLRKESEQYLGATIKRGHTLEQLKLSIHDAEKELASIGNVNLRALDVYEQIAEEHKKLTDKTTKLHTEKDDVLKMMQEIEGKKKDIFMKTYNVLVKNFKTIFSSLTTKGEAHVELENQENPFDGGVDIQVRIIGDKTLDIKSLSGGEKTLAALSFIFAIQEYSPSPFYLMDEVDAALDKKNSELLSKLIQKYSKKAQYIVITHNDAMIGEADTIYGISMQDGVSKVVSLKV